MRSRNGYRPGNNNTAMNTAVEEHILSICTPALLVFSADSVFPVKLTNSCENQVSASQTANKPIKRINAYPLCKGLQNQSCQGQNLILRMMIPHLTQTALYPATSTVSCSGSNNCFTIAGSCGTSSIKESNQRGGNIFIDIGS